MGALQSRPAPWCGAALQIVGGRAIRVPCLSALFCRQSGQTQKADITDIQQLLGHQRPTTTDIYLRSVAPNLDRLAGVIEGVVGDIAIHRDEAEAEG